MLLPSPLPSEPFLPASKPIRLTPRTLGAYQPFASQCASSASTLIASCRALQSIIGSTPLSCQNGKQSDSQARSSAVRRRTTETQATRDPLLPCVHNAKVRKTSPVKPKPVTRGHRKRRRDEYEAEIGSDNGKIGVQSPSFDQENSDTFSTPKRQRRIPLSIPLGLTAADFQSLDSDSPHRDVELDMPDPPPLDNITETDSHSQADSEWTPADDSALVSTVLEKLQLSKREWNDCARILGKDQDSIGKRWKLLVGDDMVGLRRGGKRLPRTGLDIRSW